MTRSIIEGGSDSFLESLIAILEEAMIDQSRAPLWEALEQHISASKGNFHVPGHKADLSFDNGALDRFAGILPIDRTEIGKLDDLHAATGVIHEAEMLAAAAFGADTTHFLVGGTTAGNLAVILSLCGPGDIILVQRSCHLSVFNGCMLAGATVVPISYELDPTTGMELPLNSETVESLLALYPEAKAVVITSPTYFGVVSPIKTIAELVHAKGIPLVVDEAHGAHFGFHPALPDSAIHAGADVVIQSTHKMLTSLTMSSMLHMSGVLINKESIQRYLRIIQSSSPSYPLMASLDLARRNIVLDGREKIDQVLTWLKQFRNQLHTLSAFRELIPTSSIDPFKLSLATHGQCTGYELAARLEQRGIYTELADEQKVLLVFSLATSNKEIDFLLKTLMEFQTELINSKVNKTSLPMPPIIEGELIHYAECRTKEQKQLPMKQAVGKRCAVPLVPYPPGIPTVLMGEVIESATVEYLLSCLQSGGKVRGIQQSNQQFYVSVFT